MALDADNVRVAVTGAVYVAPTGTTLPVTADNILDAAFDDLGYVSEDGVVESQGTDSNDIKAWQNGAIVRKVQTSHDLTYALTFIESNDTVRDEWYGVKVGAARQITGSQPGKRAFVIDVVDGIYEFRIAIPNGEITDRGDVSYLNGEAISYPATITCYPDDAGVKAYIYDDSDGS